MDSIKILKENEKINRSTKGGNQIHFIPRNKKKANMVETNDSQQTQNPWMLPCGGKKKNLHVWLSKNLEMGKFSWIILWPQYNHKGL